MSEVEPFRHFIHIGYHKTASTWLHRVLFPAVEGAHSLSRDPIFRSLLLNLQTAADDEFASQTFKAAVSERSSAVGMPLLVGDERLSGDVWNASRNWERNAHRLKAIFPRARVWIMIRQQAEMIRSLHKQYVQEGGFGRLSQFIDGKAPGCSFDPKHLEYDRLISTYRELFGPSSVSVIAYECLRDAPDEFLREFANFAHVTIPADFDGRAMDVNRSISAPSTALLRAWNRAFRVSKFNNRPRIVPIPGGSAIRRVLQHRLDPILRRIFRPWVARAGDLSSLEAFSTRYAESNHRTQGFCAEDLERYGYPF